LGKALHTAHWQHKLLLLLLLLLESESYKRWVCLRLGRLWHTSNWC
jgi:hypothetical protein